MGKHFDEALKLIAADKLDDAEKLADDIDDVISDLEEDRDLIRDVIEHKRGPRPKPKGKPKQQLKLPLTAAKDNDRKPRLRKVKEADRSTLIKNVAQEVKGNNGKVFIGDVAKAIEAEQEDLWQWPGAVGQRP